VWFNSKIGKKTCSRAELTENMRSVAILGNCQQGKWLRSPEWLTQCCRRRRGCRYDLVLKNVVCERKNCKRGRPSAFKGSGSACAAKHYEHIEEFYSRSYLLQDFYFLNKNCSGGAFLKFAQISKQFILIKCLNYFSSILPGPVQSSQPSPAQTWRLDQ
jgi:hypothetical protein